MATLPKAKNEERLLKAAREQWLITEKESLTRLTADFPSETMKVKKQEGGHKVMKEKKTANREIYSQNYTWKVKDKFRHA